MHDGLQFLIAARRCEIQDLLHTLQASEILGAVASLVHTLQKERGLSNGYLASGGQIFQGELGRQAEICRGHEESLRLHFGRLLDAADGNLPLGFRLYSQCALVLHRLEGLPPLRLQIKARQVGADAAVQSFTDTIAGLLALVFIAVDSRSLGTGQPGIARLLLAFFNLSEAKEFAGQERAWGTAFFAGSAAQRLIQNGAHWQYLVAQQENCLALFTQFASPAQLAHWNAALTPKVGSCQSIENELKHLRLQASMSEGSRSLDASLSNVWFDCCTRRMDAMKQTEEHLAIELQALCRQKLAQARKELHGLQSILAGLGTDAPATGSQATNANPDTPPPKTAQRAHPDSGKTPQNAQLGHFVQNMLAQQSQRIEAMQSELGAVQAALGERKVVERAKALLMRQRNISEAQAYVWLRQSAMNQSRRLSEVALSLLMLAHYSPAP